MEAQEAVTIAKRHVDDLFRPEGLKESRLEEIEYDEGQGVWRVTVGMVRPIRIGAFADVLSDLSAKRGDETPGVIVYRVASIRDADKRVLSVKMRD